MALILLTGLVLAASPTLALVSQDGTGRLPAMGWNSWNEFGCDINEDVFITVGQRLVELGLKDLGYNYVNIDDCWSDKEKRRDPVTKEIVIDKVKFPQGIAHTTEKLHELGLKVGIYSDAGTSTCGGYEGSLGYEDIDAASFSNWGIDYLKYDNCDVPANWTDDYIYYPEDPLANPPLPPPNYSYSLSRTATRYARMRDALLSQPRTIQYSLCAWGHAHVERWGNTTGHSWRMWGDIAPIWSGQDRWSWGLMPIINQAALTWNHTNFWGHNDWDMMEVGNGNFTDEENRSHFAMWCALKSPLIIGTRLDEGSLKESVLEILGNRELIEFNQDGVYGESAMPFKWDGVGDRVHPAGYWVGTSRRGLHLFLLNTEEGVKRMEVRLGEIPGLVLEGGGDDGVGKGKGKGNSGKGKKEEEYIVHDMWSGKDIGRIKADGVISLDVKAHDTAALRITTLRGTHPNPDWIPK